MDNIATYILGEKDYIQKMIIAYYLSRKTGIFFDKATVLRAQIARMFIHYAMLDVDENEVITEMLLCNCKKIDDSQKIGRLETYAKEGADYLRTLGFSKRFCKVCEEVNRYSESEPREVESDILEVVDQFTGLILNRVERPAFTIEEALVILKERNLKGLNNIFLDKFIDFINDMDGVFIKETIEVPVIKKLVSLHNSEANIKTFIMTLGNNYSDRIDGLINDIIERKMIGQPSDENVRIVKRYVKVENTPERALFSKEIADRVLKHESSYKVDKQ